MYRTDEYVFSYPNSAVHYCMALTQHTIYTVKARAICIIMLFLVLLDVFGYVVPNYDTHTADQTEITKRKIPMSRVIRTNCFTATGTAPFIP